MRADVTKALWAQVRPGRKAYNHGSAAQQV